MIPVNFIGQHKAIDQGDYKTEAGKLQCSTAIIHAFFDVESSGSGFFTTGEPKILFEARYFHLLTKGKFDSVAPNISSPVWNKSLYFGGVAEYKRLRNAIQYDRDSALKSCSIGASQIMGANFKMVGFVSIDEMWEKFCDDAENHLIAFGNYIKATGLLDELQNDPPEFTALAIGYNGSGQAANGYDQKLETTYEHYVRQGEGDIPSGEVGRADDPHAEVPSQPTSDVSDGKIKRVLLAGSTGEDVGILQRYLKINDDNIYGRQQTVPAVRAWQMEHNLLADGKAGKQTLSAMGLWGEK